MPKHTVYTLLCTPAHPACHMDGISLHESLSVWDAYIGSAIPSLALKMANGRTLLVKVETSHQRTFDLVNQPQSCQPASQFSKTFAATQRTHRESCADEIWCEASSASTGVQCSCQQRPLLTITLTLLPWMFLPHAGSLASKAQQISMHNCAYLHIAMSS